MAQTMICDGPDTDPAVFIIQFVTEAEVVALCPSCAIGWAVALLTELAPDMVAKPPAKPARKRPVKSQTEDAVAAALQNADDERSEHAAG